MCGDYYNKVPKFFDTSPSKGKNLCPSLSNLSSLTTSIIKYHRSDTRSVILGRLRPQKPAASSFCLLKCSLLEPSRHAVQRPRACAGVPAHPLSCGGQWSSNALETSPQSWLVRSSLVTYILPHSILPPKPCFS